MDPDSCLLFVANNLGFVSLLPVTVEAVVCIGLILLLLVISALISASETAFFSLSTEDIKKLEDDKKPAGIRVFTLLQAPDKLLATIHITNLFAKTAVVILSACVIYSVVSTGNPMDGFLLLAVTVVFLLLVICEIAPKMYASHHALPVLCRMSYLIAVFQKIFYPLVFLWVSSTSAARKRAQKRQSISIDDLSSALEKKSDIVAENKNILKGIVKFGNIDVHTIMTPRMDVESVDLNTSLSALIAKINEWGYSRIPVYTDTPDNIKGILYVKDILPYIEETDRFPWQKLVREAYFVPEHKKIDDLLKEFQEMKMHMAVIIDEYGGMVGIVTLEDILEEIMGDIADESDDDELGYVQINEHTYLFDGKVLLIDFFRIMRLDEAMFEPVRGEADTLAGMILEIKGEIPQKGDCVDYKNMSFCVESVDNRRIKQIKVIINVPEEK